MHGLLASLVCLARLTGWDFVLDRRPGVFATADLEGPSKHWNTIVIRAVINKKADLVFSFGNHLPRATHHCLMGYYAEKTLVENPSWLLE